jgi:hypothetical protein
MHDIAVISERSGGLLKSRTPMGDINDVNADTFAPVSNITEVSPITYTEMDIANLAGVVNSGVTL